MDLERLELGERLGSGRTGQQQMRHRQYIDGTELFEFGNSATKSGAGLVGDGLKTRPTHNAIGLKPFMALMLSLK